MKTKGIHHISSIVGDAQKDLDFYTGVLALRLVKLTLNYEDKNHYHLYYGNKNASSGIVTTFPMNNYVPGRIGDGQVAVTSYGMKLKSFDFWKQRFTQEGIEFDEYTRFNLKRLAFQDPDGLRLEFIESDFEDEFPWEASGVQSKDAFKGIESATLYSYQPQDTLDLLVDLMGYELVDEDEEYYFLKIHESQGGKLELSKHRRGPGQAALGTVHHIALGVENESIEQWKEHLLEAGYFPGEVKDRNYFKSLYFRDKGGIIFELATQGPGLLIDESLETLGESFIIPEHFKDYKEEIFRSLKPLKLNNQ